MIVCASIEVSGADAGTRVNFNEGGFDAPQVKALQATTAVARWFVAKPATFNLHGVTGACPRCGALGLLALG